MKYHTMYMNPRCENGTDLKRTTELDIHPEIRPILLHLADWKVVLVSVSFGLKVQNRYKAKIHFCTTICIFNFRIETCVCLLSIVKE